MKSTLECLDTEISISSRIDFTQIIVLGGDRDFDALSLCLQAILANTDLDSIKILVYLSGERKLRAKQIIERFGGLVELEVRHYNSDRVSYLIADAARNRSTESALVLLSCEAIVAKGWLTALTETAQSREDIAIVTSRQIKHRNDRSAWEVIPYANNNHDIDVALSPTDNIVLDPGFDQSTGAIELNSFNLFCTLFSPQIIDKLQLQYSIGLDDFNWIMEIANAIGQIERMHIVYTPKSKVFDVSYFQ
jgi:hypothetical protein